MIAVWILVFIISIGVLVKSADWFIESAEKIGFALKISPFMIGITVVAIGTSFPELISSLFAVFKGETEIVVANAIGSNITNILLIIGLSTIIARRMVVRRSLIDLDTPLLGLTTIIFILIILDGQIVFGEGILLLLAFVVYVLYTIFRKREADYKPPEETYLPSRSERRKLDLSRRWEASRGILEIERKLKAELVKIDRKVYFFLFLGMAGLALGANFTIESMMEIASFFQVSTSLLAITALAFGTSLPELIVSVKAAAQKKYEIALGNIFGSNVFNALLITGVPALIRPLAVDELTLTIGLPFLIMATLVLVISTITRRLYIWEGAMFILIYILFIAKITGIL